MKLSTTCGNVSPYLDFLQLPTKRQTGISFAATSPLPFASFAGDAAGRASPASPAGWQRRPAERGQLAIDSVLPGRPNPKQLGMTDDPVVVVGARWHGGWHEGSSWRMIGHRWPGGQSFRGSGFGLTRFRLVFADQVLVIFPNWVNLFVGNRCVLSRFLQASLWDGFEGHR